MGKKNLNLDSWKRKEHFKFFSGFDEPFYCISAEIDCARAYKKAKAGNLSFFVYYLHKTITAVNRVKEFKYRIEGDNVVVYDKINVSATIAREDNTFAFSFIDYDPDLEIFSRNAKKEINRIQKTSGLFCNPESERLDVVHFSSIPWISFTGMTHARNYNSADSVPKITFGKMSDSGQSKKMPVSVMVHHGLVDGYHIGQYINTLQSLMDE
ncbi:MAG: chloramphenicol acetyltransferase [Elusimicrobia bacterium]|nr:chloramphenicol acetyltransferase [Elusimicrobiota bacterium]